MWFDSKIDCFSGVDTNPMVAQDHVKRPWAHLTVHLLIALKGHGVATLQRSGKESAKAAIFYLYLGDVLLRSIQTYNPISLWGSFPPE